ncbi:MAG TPA: ABC transporter ATP-binding protein [Solirubrobacteraceae bacterium]|nr:ABC transporter ATP-binding protein [Solirubrobacteraceae bacterium]
MPTELQSRPQPRDGRLARSGAGELAQAGASAAALEGVSRSYRAPARGGLRRRSRGERAVQALGGMSLAVAPGELVAVVGPSGCGKSTLLELMCGLQRPDAGTVACLPAVLMPQRDLLLGWLGALDNAALGVRIAGASRAQARERAGALFAELGLDGFQRARPHELSGGMRQRVAFARTLLSGKPLLCLDEPFGALDAITRAQMQDWLAAVLARERRTVVLVTHDVEEAALLADRVLVLSPRPGRVLAEIPVQTPRPRARTAPAVLEARRRALAELGMGATA